MRARRGLKPATEKAVASLSEQEIEDLLTAFPFMAPILPVMAVGALATHRTPRKGSKAPPPGKSFLTPRNTIANLLLQSARLEIQHEKLHYRTPPTEFQLTSSEVELATKAWLQILSTGASEPEGGGGGGKSGTGSSNSHQALFHKACTVTSVLTTGTQLKDVLQLLNIPILNSIVCFVDDIVHLLSINSTPGAEVGCLHFFRFLQLLCQCKHFDAIKRLHQRTRHGVLLPPRAASPFRGDVEAVDSNDGAAMLELLEHFDSDEENAATTLDQQDIEATFGYLLQAEQSGKGGVPASNKVVSPREAPHATPREASTTQHVSAKAIEEFAQSFYLSIAALLPPEYLLIPPSPVGSPQQTSRRDSHRSATPGGLVPSGSLNLTPEPTSRWGRSTASPTPLPPTASISAGGASSSANPQPKRVAVSLQPSMADHEVTLKDFSHFVAKKMNEDHHRPAERHSLPPSFSVAKPPLNNDANSIVAGGSDRLKLLRIPQALGGAQPETVRDEAANAKDSKGPAKDGPPHLAIQQYSTWSERRSCFSTLQLQPNTYSAFCESKERKAAEEEHRKQLEHKLKEDYLYGAPRPKPKALPPKEEYATVVKNVSALLSSSGGHELFDASALQQRVHSIQSTMKERERREALLHSYSPFAPDKGLLTDTRQAKIERFNAPKVLSREVRQTAAMDVLSMLTNSADDSLLGAQTSAKREAQLRGMNGMVSKARKSLTPQPVRSVRSLSDTS